MIKGVFFDLDGTLVDAKEWHYESLNLALAPYNCQISREEHLTIFDGLPTSKKLEKLSVLGRIETRNFAEIKRNKSKYTKEILEKTDIFNLEIYRAFQLLYWSGYRIAVCSNSVRDFIFLCLEKMNLTESVDLVLSNEDVLSPKPNPEMYNKAIQVFGLQPSECLIFEDNFNGIAAAKASGAHVFEVKSVDDINQQVVFREISRINLCL